jgi:tetratricopeptide (TPR) repeat protein
MMVLYGCGRDRVVYKWNERVLAAGELQDEGKLDEAEARYRKLLESSPDADARRHVLNELGAIAEERGDWKRALALYKKVWTEEIDDEAGGHALYHAATIVDEELGQTERGLAMKRKVAKRYPKSVSAEFAARDLVGHYEARGDFDAMRAAVDALYEDVADTPVADNMLFAAGESLEVEAKDEDAALPYYRKVYDTYPEGGLADDALWQAAMIYHRRQQWTPAIRLLTRLADNVETSWFVGSYNSPWANDARFELGLIHLMYLDDYDAALAHFERYLEDFPTSLQLDDAGWHIVHLYRLMGDQERYREALGEFIKRYPESRYVRVARELLEGDGQ